LAAITSRAAVIHVPADYPTIQAAVDAAASGDEIQIAAGVYSGQVDIVHKDLTLSGSPGAVLRATPGMHFSLAPEIGNWRSCLLAIYQSDVEVSGLTFEGQQLGEIVPGGLIGIVFFRASGRIEDCRITGFRSEALSPGAGLKITNPHPYGSVIHVDVLGNTFDDNHESIILSGDEYGPDGLWDPGALRTTFTVKDNIILGDGPDATGTQHGISIWAGAGGEVKQNLIAYHAFVGVDAFPISFGLLAFDFVNFYHGDLLAALQPVRYEGNVFLDNQVHMGMARGDDSMVVNNDFEGTAPGFRPTGLMLSGEDVKVVANRFDDMDAGIVLFGLDPVFGTLFGIASNATVVANQFCHVDKPVIVEQSATGTQEGNQLDACH